MQRLQQLYNPEFLKNDPGVPGKNRVRNDFTLSLLTLALPMGGGARRDRTADPLLAKQVLSQLSYGPF